MTVLSSPPASLSGASFLSCIAGDHRDAFFSRVLHLSEQHESLSERLDQLRSLRSLPVTSSNTAVATPSRSPARAATHSPSSTSSSMSTSPCHAPFKVLRRTSIPSSVPPASLTFRGAGYRDDAPSADLLSELITEEAKLLDINEDLKHALTELLNCEAVRADDNARTWVQYRLYQTERELRRGRRRRAS